MYSIYAKCVTTTYLNVYSVPILQIELNILTSPKRSL